MRKKTYNIVFTRQSEKQFKSLPGKVKKEAAMALEAIACDPLSGKALQGRFKPLRSKRIGKYRIVYNQQKDKLIIVVIDIAHRKAVYKSR